MLNKTTVIFNEYIKILIVPLIFSLLIFSPSSGFCRTVYEFDLKRYVQNTAKHTIIHVPKGVHYVTKPIELPSDTTLEGEGVDTVLKFISPYSGGKFITNKDHRNGNNNITIKSLTIEFDSATLKDDSPGIVRFENVANLTIGNVVANIKSDLFAIDIASYCRNVLIEDCVITNYGNGGCLMVRNRDKSPDHLTSFVIVRNNTLKSTVTDEAIAVYGWLGKVSDVEVHNNKVQAYDASYGISVFGIEKSYQTGSLSKVIVRDNEIWGSRTGGIGVKGGASDIQVTDNRISMTKGDGIFIHAGASDLPKVNQVLIKSNIIKNIGRHGVFATGYEVNVDYNMIDSCRQSGVYVGDNVKVTNNTISNSSPGIYVEGKLNVIVQRNRLTNAKINVLNGDLAGIRDNIVN